MHLIIRFQKIINNYLYVRTNIEPICTYYTYYSHDKYNMFPHDFYLYSSRP